MGLRVVFMGTPDFAREALKAIHETTNHDIIAVYSQPPRPKGRGQQVQKSPVQDYADTHNIPAFHPKSLKSAQEQQEFAALNADIAIVAAYGLILPAEILNAPGLGCINIHASLLPRWRGAAPIQRAIWAGDQETGVTLMQMDEGLDTGDMLAIDTVNINAQTTAATLHDDLATMGARMICTLLEQAHEQNMPLAIKQDETQSNYASMLSKEDGCIDWSQSATEIERQIRALTPWPGVWTERADERLKIHDATIIDGEQTNTLPGTILNKKGDISCGSGSTLRLEKIQPAGKKAMDFTSALNGSYIQIGDLLS